MMRARSSLAILLAVGVMLTPAAARAGDPPSDGASSERAAAALFYEARGLMKKGQFAAACAKFEESLRVDHGIGTEFNLADCNERVGKLATAWSGFQSVAAAARSANQPDRERIARGRAKALEPKLPRLVIDVPSPEVGLEVKLDGQPVEPLRWGTAFPVDPGVREIVASAPGKEPHKLSVSAVRGAVARVTLPRTLLVGAVAVAPASTSEASDTSVTGSATLSSYDLATPAADRGSSQRTLAYVVGGVGIAGLGVAAIFGLDSMARSDRANLHCSGDICDAEGVGYRDDAIRSGNVATVATVAGGAALATGIILLVTAPSSSDRPGAAATRSPRPRSLAAAPLVVVGGGGLSLQGALP